MANAKRILTDTLKVNGRYSKKNLTILVTFVTVLFLGFYISLSDHFLDKEINRYAINVFDSLLIFLATLMGISEASKKFLNKATTDFKEDAVDKKESIVNSKLESEKEKEIIG